jgi:phytoene dehydrogenase-like protein
MGILVSVSFTSAIVTNSKRGLSAERVVEFGKTGDSIMETAVTRSAYTDLIVVGGGLAGLCAAALVARAGRTVVVLEKASHLGGRAATHVRDQIHWNLGAHALYCHGHTFRLITELGVRFTGCIPSPGRALLFAGNVPYRLPAGFGSLVGSQLLSLREKWRLARLLTTLAQLDSRQFDGVPLRDWLEQTAGAGNLSLFLRALCRLSTYSDDPVRMSAGAAVQQLKLALAGNVWYLDGGWQTLVDGLRDQGAKYGAKFRTGAAVRAVDRGGGAVVVHLASGEILRGRAAVLAVEPTTALDMLDLPAESPLARWAGKNVAVRAACLDLALSRLTRPRQRFALGLDRPYYASVHSAAAALAPPNVAIVHVMKYIGNDTATPSQATERELECFLDQLQPGWRAHILARRFMPGMAVSHGLPLTESYGLRGRPPVTIRERPNVFLAGDWVGPEGMLADASAASAAESARLVLAALDRTKAAERSPLHVAS